MNVMQRVTLQTLKKNKRRTIVTILGTAVAVAMVTAVAVVAASFLDMMVRQEIETSGEWHVAYGSVPPSGEAAVAGAEGVKFYTASSDLGNALLPGRENYTRSALALVGYRPQDWAHLPLQVTEGRLPEKDGEIFLSNAFKSTGGQDWALGQTLRLDTGRRGYVTDMYGEQSLYLSEGIYAGGNLWVSGGERDFTVVGYGDMGFAETDWQNAFTALTVLPETLPVPMTGTSEEGLPYLDEHTGLLQLRLMLEKPTNDLFEYFGGLSARVYKDSPVIYGPQYNSLLLSMEGVAVYSGMFNALIAFCAILLMIILVGSVSLIYNAFSISLAERVRALGMLAGVGATKRQKRSSVMFEALLIGVFAIPLGILGGIAGIAITLNVLEPAIQNVFGIGVDIKVSFPLWSLLVILAFSALILYLSAWIPAFRAARISPVDAMRGSRTVKVRRVRTSRLTRYIFGFEAELGIKNSKRSRSRYFAILSSLVVSVLLFLTVSGAMNYVQDGVELSEGNAETNMELYMYRDAFYADEGARDLSELVADYRAIPGGEALYLYNSVWLYAELTEAQVLESKLENLTPGPEGNYLENVQVVGLDEQSLGKYLGEAGLAGQGLAMGEALLISPVRAYVNDRLVSEHGSRLKAGDGFSLFQESYSEAGDLTLADKTPLRVAAVSAQFPSFLNNTAYGSPQVLLVVGMDTMDHLFRNQPDRRGSFVLTGLVPDPAAYTEAAEAIDSGSAIFVNIYNTNESMERDRMTLFIIQVFTYGFVVLIILVCAANIFNTVTTGILLRAREFAMLRSVGLTPKGFNRMLDCETIFYGVKALVYGIPLSVLVTLWLYSAMSGGFGIDFSLPLWSYLVAVAGVFLLVGSSVLIARRKVRSMNIAETLKNENW